jgi:hypothetical protein
MGPLPPSMDQRVLLAIDCGPADAPVRCAAISLLFRLKVGRHFTPLLGEMAIRALRLKISRYSRCVLTLLRFSPTFLHTIGHHQTLMNRPPAADFAADAVQFLGMALKIAVRSRLSPLKHKNARNRSRSMPAHV